MEPARRAILARALEIVGTRELLAKRFNVRPTVVDAWLSGATPIPEAVFLTAVDIVQPRLPDEDTPP